MKKEPISNKPARKNKKVWHQLCLECFSLSHFLAKNVTENVVMKYRHDFISCGSMNFILTAHGLYCNLTGTNVAPSYSVHITNVLGKPLPDLDCQCESALNFIPLNCWIKMPPWLLSLGAQLLLIGGLKAEPMKQSVSFDLPGLCSLIQTEQCET